MQKKFHLSLVRIGFLFFAFQCSTLFAEDETRKTVLIVMPAYNAEKTIADSIKSILRQTHQDWRLVVVDDASTDGTVDVVETFMDRDARIQLIRHDINSGSPAVARNTGLEDLRETHIAFLDADDLWLPAKLTKQLHFMAARQLDFSFTSFRAMTGNQVGELQQAPARVTYRDLLELSTIALSSVVIDVSRVGRPSFTNEPAVEDYILWLQLLRQNYRAGGLQEDLMRYQVMDGSLSSNKLRMAKKRWKVYRVHEQLGFASSAYYFAHYAFRTFYKHMKRRQALRSPQKCDQSFEPLFQ